VALLIVACTDSAVEPPFLPLQGTWAYDGSQATPVAAVARGSFEVRSQNGRGFTGVFSLIETEAGGVPSPLQGLVDGRIVDSASLDMQLRLSDASRRHLGTLRGDTLRGTWVETTAGGLAATGSFTAVRQP
jgi:hypothetical protein